MITSIEIRNFKSLADFSMQGMGKFSCLIGLNGAGKTTLLQALDFIAHLASGQVESWLAMRGWTSRDLLTKGCAKKTIEFKVVLEHGSRRLCWEATYNVVTARCTYEVIVREDGKPIASALELTGGSLSTGDRDIVAQDVSKQKYQGSILSAFMFKDQDIKLVIDTLNGLKNLELLSPHFLRGNAQANEDIGRGGEALPGFLSKLSRDDSECLMRELTQYYPELSKVTVRRKRFGWKSLLFDEAAHQFESRQINDGLLRILAIISQRYSSHSFLLFDEIENGINQELVEKLLDSLQDFNGKQIMVTTHSSLVLNYLDDEVARENVFLLYKDEQHHTQAVKFFHLRAVGKKLGILGPGEAMSDTDLTNLNYSARI